MSDSYVKVDPRGTTSYVGPDAANLARAILLQSALDMWAKTGMIPTRGINGKAMLAMAAAV